MEADWVIVQKWSRGQIANADCFTSVKRQKGSVMLEAVVRQAQHVQRGSVLALVVEMRSDDKLIVCPAVQNTKWTVLLSV